MKKTHKKYDIIHETAMISAIITENFFELLYNKLQIGAMGTFEQITQFAIDFEKKYREIKDWEEESDKQNCYDWEDCIQKYVLNEINKRF